MDGHVRRKGQNWYIDLYWKGERILLYSNKAGDPFYSEREAERFLERLRSEIAANDFNPKHYIKQEIKALLFENYAASWLGRQRKRQLSREYLRSVESYLRNHLIPALGKRSIRDINRGTIEDFLGDLPSTLSAKTRSNILGVLHKVLSDAHGREDLAKVPVFPKIHVPEPHTKWITLEEQALVLKEVTDPVRLALFIFLAHQGCRPGEARALRWEDIDWKAGRVTIHAAMDQEYYRPSTKEKDVRTIPMHPDVITALKGLPRALSGFVFTFNGKPLQKKLVCKVWRKAAKAAGIDITCYQGTKHSLGTWAVNHGVSLNIIQAYMGHKSPESTKRYAKLQVDSMKAMHDKVEQDSPQIVPNSK